MLSRNYKSFIIESLIKESANATSNKLYDQLKTTLDTHLYNLGDKFVYMKKIDKGIELFFKNTNGQHSGNFLMFNNLADVKEDALKCKNNPQCPPIKFYNLTDNTIIYRQTLHFDSLELYIPNGQITSYTSNSYDYIVYDTTFGGITFCQEEFDESIPATHIEEYISNLVNTKNQDIDFVNLNIEDKIKLLASYDDEDIKEDNNFNNNTLFSDSGKNLILNPQNLIKSTGYFSRDQIKQMAESNLLPLIKEKEQQNKLDTEYLSCNTVYNLLEKSTTGNGLEPIDLFDGQSIDLHKVIKKYKTSGGDMGFERGTIGHSVLKNLSVYPGEVLSPLYFTSMDKNIQWGKDGNMGSKQILNKIFGDDSVFHNAKISYPTFGEQLIDSVIAIKVGDSYKKLGLSTKGGINGEGAAASLNSLYSMLLEKEDKTRYQNSDKISKIVIAGLSDVDTIKDKLFSALPLTNYAKALIKNYPTEVAFLLTFGGCKTSIHADIMRNIMKQGHFLDISFNDCHSVRDMVKKINSESNLSTCIIQLLNYQKYDMAQMNLKPNMTDDTFNYECSIQYPAHFDGHVDIELAQNSKGKPYFKFHILASKS